MTEASVKPFQHRWIAFAAALLSGGFPLLGSMASILCSAAGLIAFLMMLTGRLPLLKGTAITWLSAAILLYLAVGGLSYALHPSDQGNLEQFLMRLVFLWFVPLASLFAVLDRQSLLQAVRYGAALGAIAAAAFAVIELTYLRQRAWGGSGNPGPYATVAAVQLGILVFALVPPRRHDRVLYAIGALSTAWCVYASGMRSVLPLLVVFPAILAFCQFRQSPGFGMPAAQSPQGKVIALSAIVMILAGSTLIISHDRFWQIQNELATPLAENPTDTSIGHRIAIVRFIVDNWRSAWPLGTGQATAMEALTAYTRDNFGFPLGKTHMHNYFISAYMRGGLPDLAVSFLFLFALPSVALMVRQRNISRNTETFAMATSLWLSYFLSSQLNLAFGHDILDHFHVFMLAVIAALWSKPGSGSTSP